MANYTTVYCPGFFESDVNIINKEAYRKLKKVDLCLVAFIKQPITNPKNGDSPQ